VHKGLEEKREPEIHWETETSEQDRQTWQKLMSSVVVAFVLIVAD